jgi:hypothetical protein
MNHEPVAWMWSEDGCSLGVCLDQEKQIGKQEFQDYDIPLYTQDQLEEARKLGMQQERALWNLAESTQEIMDTHPVKEKGLPRSSPSPMNQACLTRSDNYISDEVIEQLAKQFGVVGLHEDAGLYEFARAILRKAQEK